MAKLNITTSTFNLRILEICRERLDKSGIGSSKDFKLLTEPSKHAEAQYALLENMEKLVDEPNFCFFVGVRLFDEDCLRGDIQRSLLENLVSICSVLTIVSNYATFHIDIVGDRILINLRRVLSSNPEVKSVNALIVGYLLKMIKHFVGEQYDSADLILHVKGDVSIDSRFCDSILPVMGKYEISINIPSSWTFSVTAERPEINVLTTIDTIREKCSDNMLSVDWGVKDLANECHLSTRTLQRLLAQNNTTFRKIMNSIRLAYAEGLIEQGKNNNEIAKELGLSSASAFCRFYKASTAQVKSTI